MASKLEEAFETKVTTVKALLENASELFAVRADGMRGDAQWGDVNDMARIESAVKQALAVMLNCDPSEVGVCPSCGDPMVGEGVCVECTDFDEVTCEDCGHAISSEDIAEFQAEAGAALLPRTCADDCIGGLS